MKTMKPIKPKIKKKADPKKVKLSQPTRMTLNIKRIIVFQTPKMQKGKSIITTILKNLPFPKHLKQRKAIKSYLVQM